MRKEFKNAIRDYIGEFKHEITITHYVVTTFDGERVGMGRYSTLDRARAAAKQWDGQVWEIIPNDGTTGAIARARG